MSTALERALGKMERFRFDPVGFARYVLEYEPTDKQIEWLENANGRQNAFTAGNRTGKSDITAVRHIHRETFRKGWTAEIKAAMLRKGGDESLFRGINASKTADQARIVVSKAYGMLQRPTASWLLHPKKPYQSTPFPTLRFVTGATLQSRSTTRNGEHLLGFSMDHFSWDECAFEKNFVRIRDNVVKMRMLDRSGTIDYVSTGNGRNEYGMFFLDMLAGKVPGGAYALQASTFSNPHVSPEELEAIVAGLSLRMRRQVIEGDIVATGGGFFFHEDVEKCEDDDLTRQMCVHQRDDREAIAHMEIYPGRDVEKYKQGEPWVQKYPDHRYIAFWDLADKKDWMVLTVLDVTTKPYVMVEWRRFQKQGWEYNNAAMVAVNAKYARDTGRRVTKFDSTGVGDVVKDRLRALDEDMAAEGLNFAGGRKDEMLTNEQIALSLREVIYPDIPQFRDEMLSYERDDKKLVQDCVMSFGGALWFARGRRHTRKFQTTAIAPPTKATTSERDLRSVLTRLTTTRPAPPKVVTTVDDEPLYVAEPSDGTTPRVRETASGIVVIGS